MQLPARLLSMMALSLATAWAASPGAGPAVVQTIEHARQLSFGHVGVQVQVQGVVIEAPGRLPAEPRFFHIQDQSAGIAVLPPERISLKLGDCVKVAGTTTLFNDLEPQLDASWVVMSDSACGAPQARVLPVDEVRSGQGSGGLVRVKGRVIDSSAGDDRALMLFGNDKAPLRAVLRRPGGALTEIRCRTLAGAVVEVVGISLPSADGKSHYLRLRQASDVTQIQPPPFHPHPALLWLTAILIGVGVASIIWITTLRKAVARKTRESRLLLEQAQSASHLKSQFLANMSHEIRTPIHGIMGMQEIVLQSNLQPAQRESLEIAHNATRSLLSLLNDILDLSKIEADSLELNLEPMNLPELIEDLHCQFRASSMLSAVAFEVHVDRDVPAYVTGDPVRLRQVLANLLSNAFKFTSVGSVTLRCSLAERREDVARVRFAIRDTGIGIPEAERERIFSAFHQADRSITRRFGGTGLGLTIASRLVELMNGKLNCESREGEGSHFWFEVDLRLAESPAVALPAAEAQVPARALRILLAEDNPVNQLIVRRPLEARGHQVVACEDGEKAVKQCAQSAFDVVLMDVQMPILDGLEATRRIREREAQLHSPRVPILALTANSLSEQVQECYEAGMDACLCKPFIPSDLLNLIWQHARQHSDGNTPPAPPVA
jgi:signal transduction histidine kinase/CheY-like chemotaxis protein